VTIVKNRENLKLKDLSVLRSRQISSFIELIYSERA